MNIQIEKLTYEELKQRALDVHNEYYEGRAEKAGNFHIEIQMHEVAEDILQEWMISLIQDEMVMTDVEDKTSTDYKIAVLQQIKEVYPELTTEVNRHLSIFLSRK